MIFARLKLVSGFDRPGFGYALLAGFKLVSGFDRPGFGYAAGCEAGLRPAVRSNS
jgi:hypothetical protein